MIIVYYYDHLVMLCITVVISLETWLWTVRPLMDKPRVGVGLPDNTQCYSLNVSNDASPVARQSTVYSLPPPVCCWLSSPSCRPCPPPPSPRHPLVPPNNLMLQCIAEITTGDQVMAPTISIPVIVVITILLTVVGCLLLCLCWKSRKRCGRSSQVGRAPLVNDPE